MATHYEQLLSRLPACTLEQRAAFLAQAVSRAVRALAARQPGNPNARAMQERLNEILVRLPTGLLPAESLEPLDRLATKMLQASAADGDVGEPKDRVAFYVAAATLLLCGVLTGRLEDPKQAAMCASHVIHVVEQVYEDEEVGRWEKDWQAHALLSTDGPLSSAAILALPDYDPGPVCWSKR